MTENSKPVYTLGISCYYHDSGVALFKDGMLLSAVEEERFNRRKHYSDFPARSVKYCLEREGITIEDVDHIGFYEKPLTKFNRILETILTYWPLSYKSWLKSMPVWLGEKLHISREIQKKLGTEKDILFCQHHLSHAASAFLVSPYEEAAILTADGVGEWTTTGWGIGKGNNIEMKEVLNFPHSVGLLFSAITAYLGFRVNDAEWKVMGLAPYGKPTHVDKFREVVDIKDDGSIRLNMKYFTHGYSTKRMYNKKWEQLFGQPTRDVESDLTDFHQDIAHSGQKIVEEIMVKMANHVYQMTGLKNLCMAGGVALNCVANWRILNETGFENIFIQPAAGDSGGALGVGSYINHSVLDMPRIFTMKHGYWGPEFDDDRIRHTLDRFKAKYVYVDDEKKLLSQTAQYIADGKVVAWFQERMEFGPRALGARSLLADPRNPRMKEIINAKIKFRESFRPFAPSVLREHAHEYFEMPKDMDAPFMLLVPKVREEMHKILPAITHQDGTGRVQTVTAEDNGRYYKLIKTFGDLTGVPVVVNTSFNVRGEPIVCTPRDAYDTFLKTGIDVLVLGNFVITTKPSTVDFEKGMERSRELEADSLLEAGVGMT